MKIPKLESDLNNLYEPIERYEKSLGDYSDKTTPSFLNQLDSHPAAKREAIAGVSALALLAIQASNGTKS